MLPILSELWESTPGVIYKACGTLRYLGYLCIMLNHAV